MITVLVLVILFRSRRLLGANRGKVTDRRDANPFKEGDVLARRRALEGHGFEFHFK